MEEKYKIYNVYVVQTFDVYWYEWRWFKRTKILSSDVVKNFDHYIMAKNEEDAVTFYKQRYTWEFNKCIDGFWNWNENKYKQENSKYKNEVFADVSHPTFDTLKKKLRADDFLTYCRQEIYPLEIHIKQ